MRLQDGIPDAMDMNLGVLANFGRWWGTGRSGMLQSMRSKSRTWLDDWTTTTNIILQVSLWHQNNWSVSWKKKLSQKRRHKQNWLLNIFTFQLLYFLHVDMTYLGFKGKLIFNRIFKCTHLYLCMHMYPLLIIHRHPKISMNYCRKIHSIYCIYQFSSVQSLSQVRLFVTPWIAAR